MHDDRFPVFVGLAILGIAEALADASDLRTEHGLGSYWPAPDRFVRFYLANARADEMAVHSIVVASQSTVVGVVRPRIAGIGSRVVRHGAGVRAAVRREVVQPVVVCAAVAAHWGHPVDVESDP